MSPFIAGFFTSLSLIVAIGSQNAFVLRQGLKHEYVFAVCLVCALSDGLLISAGIFGLTGLVAKYPQIADITRYAGALFLTIYALLSWRAAMHVKTGLNPMDLPSKPFWQVVVTCLAFTWLNPHVYLDTIFLIGSISTQYPGQTWSFGLGAWLASISFFFALGYGAKRLRPIFTKPSTWVLLDILIGAIMLSIALNLVLV